MVSGDYRAVQLDSFAAEPGHGLPLGWLQGLVTHRAARELSWIQRGGS
eukprot:CAMPEP_0202825100 /NCGR_PEP_ID=MMETSP1389-20130828/12805_1 /ASSEMBLY_ACC=CAM_ASM_000865 /TAXON_ID=302021 /ORGANISM="Rhodomonas sp., Strain CCMP768" /LENGTH=47 /DNA_ID= /DNA_START= /DNA_END= /DNA_ORIENTATION=